MSTYKKTDEAGRDEHAVIGGVSGKKVFVIDNAGNQIVSFSAPTVAYQPFSYYKNSSLVSGYTYHGFTTPGNAPNTATFKLQREELDRGLVLFGDGTGGFNHTWSSISLASINYS